MLVPWHGGCAHRMAAWRYVSDRYSTPIVCRGPQPWVKASAIMPVARRIHAEIVVVADADVFTDGLDEAIAAVEGGRAWALPHGKVHRLSRESTAQLLRGDINHGWETEQVPYFGVVGGGIVVLRREMLLETPLDPRFIGWGGEDVSWGYALRALYGKPWRGMKPLWHLWHPPQPSRHFPKGAPENEALARRYGAARSSPRKMRDLLDEID